MIHSNLSKRFSFKLNELLLIPILIDPSKFSSLLIFEAEKVPLFFGQLDTLN